MAHPWGATGTGANSGTYVFFSQFGEPNTITLVSPVIDLATVS